jgi:hypothetical protein
MPITDPRGWASGDTLSTRPKVRITPAGDQPVPAEITLLPDGRLRVQSGPDRLAMNGAVMTTAEFREFVTGGLGLADASDVIHGTASPS